MNPTMQTVSMVVVALSTLWLAVCVVALIVSVVEERRRLRQKDYVQQARRSALAELGEKDNE